MKVIKIKRKKKKEKESDPERKQLSASASAPSTGSPQSETRFEDGYWVRHARNQEKEGPGAGAKQEGAQSGCGSRGRRALVGAERVLD